MNNDTTSNDDSDGTETIEKRVTITIDDCPLPLTEDAREEALDDLRDAIGGLLHGHMEPASIITRTGYQYAQVPDSCPLCGTRLELRSFTYTEGGAYAEANCADALGCGWRGTAVYSLIDLEGGPGSAHESAILTDDVTPSYHPY